MALMKQEDDVYDSYSNDPRSRSAVSAEQLPPLNPDVSHHEFFVRVLEEHQEPPKLLVQGYIHDEVISAAQLPCLHDMKGTETGQEIENFKRKIREWELRLVEYLMLEEKKEFGEEKKYQKWKLLREAADERSVDLDVLTEEKETDAIESQRLKEAWETEDERSVDLDVLTEEKETDAIESQRSKEAWETEDEPNVKPKMQAAVIRFLAVYEHTKSDPLITRDPSSYILSGLSVDALGKDPIDDENVINAYETWMRMPDEEACKDCDSSCSYDCTSCSGSYYIGQKIIKSNQGRALYITKGAKYYHFTFGTREGDVICTLWHGFTSYILRSVGNGDWTLVGHCPPKVSFPMDYVLGYERDRHQKDIKTFRLV